MTLRPKLKVREVGARDDCEPGRVGVELSQSRRSLALALSHDGLWVFANRILADRIFAHGEFADWRRRHRGRLLARQIGSSGDAQHGDERSRYDYDDLHDANPLVLGTRTGRPSDAPIPLCLCKTPASAIPRSGSIAGGNGSRLFVALAMEWFKCDWEDRGRTQINQKLSQHGRRQRRSHGSLPPFFYRAAPACASNYRRRVESAPRFSWSEWSRE